MPTVKHIPTSRQFASYRQRTKLDGVEYVLRFEWQERNGGWYLRLFDQDENPLTGYVRVVLELDLLRLHHHLDGVPRGPIIALDHSGQNTGPGFDDLGERVRLVYVEGT